MDNDARARLWRELDAARDRGRYDASNLFEIARKANVVLDFDTFEQIYTSLPGHRSIGSFICPPIIRNFIAGYLQAGKADSILDPWADSLLLLPLANSVKAQHVHGFIRSPLLVEVTANLDRDHRVVWRQGGFLGAQITEETKYDAIVSCAPFGMRPVMESIELDGEKVRVRGDEASLTLLRACHYLKPDGVALFVVANGFFYPNNVDSVYTAMPHFGLAVNAAIAVPADAFRPVTSVPTTLIIIGRGSADQLFVGHLSGDPDHDYVLLQNLLTRKRGKDVTLGTIVARSEYHGYDGVASRALVAELGRKRGILPRKLSEIAVEINLTSANEYPGFAEQANAIYIPLMGVGQVISSLSQATLKHPSGYAQVVLDANLALTQYTAHYLNTALGKEARRAIITGLYRPRLAKDRIGEISVYLPDREIQLQATETLTQIENLFSTLEELRERLWTQPRRIREVDRDLKAVNRVDTFAGWLDTLPFPLASILWTYHAMGTDYQRRYERLLHFFEALAEFLSAILIAGFQQDAEWQSRTKSELKATLAGQSLNIGTFGMWVHITENLAKEARTYLNGKEEEQVRCFAMFRTTDREVLSMLFTSDIIAVLQQANDLRNSWSGHTGAVGLATARERHTVLESLLAKVRRVYSSRWQGYRLIKADTAAFERGIYRFQVELIMGTRTPFESDEVLTDQPMDYKHLYLLAEGSHQPLKLVPFIQVMPSPKTAANACYFYNRAEGDRLRFVSYHFEQDAEIIEAFPETLAALQAMVD